MAIPMSKAVIKEKLSAVPLFSTLSDPQLDSLSSATRSVPFLKGARVFEEGAPADCCYVLVSGRAKVTLESEDGVEIVLSEVAPGDLVGEVALLDGFPRSAALVAMERCYFLRIPAPALDALRSTVAFERKLVAHAMATLRDTTERVLRFSTGPSIIRVVWCLWRIARREGRRDGKAMIIPKKSQQQLAGMSGCTRETVNRLLHDLKDDNCVTWDARTMRLDIQGLQRYLRMDLTLAGRPSER